MLASVTFDSGIVTIQGDATNETFAFRSNSDQTGFTVQVDNDPASEQTFNNDDVDRVVLLAGGGDDTVSINTLRVPTEIFGGPGTDTLRGGNADDFISGGNGNDTIYGFAGNDELLGGGGDDLIFGAGGDDVIEGGLGADELLGQGGNDTLEGQGGDDFISGGVGNDTLVGGIGADDLRGNTGDDILIDSTDNDADVFRGGTGFDTFTVQGEIGNGSVDQVLDRFGMETFTGFDGPLEPSIEVDGDSISVVGTDQADNFDFRGFNSATQFNIELENQIIGTFNAADFDEVVFHLGGGNDHFDTNQSQVLIPLRVNGGDGNDFIEGGNGPDQLFGGSGDDSIHARFGDDILVGGEGNDLLHGNHDNDQLFGGTGRDNLWGDTGDDIVVAGEDDIHDRLRGNSGFDELFLELGEDLGTSGEVIGTLATAPAEPVFGGSSVVVAPIDDDTVDDDPVDGDPGSGDDDPSGDPSTASIEARVFVDGLENGVLDVIEPGLAGVTVNLMQGTTVVATQITDSEGAYKFNDLAAGDYSVELQTDTLEGRSLTTDAVQPVSLRIAEQAVGANNFGAEIVRQAIQVDRLAELLRANRADDPLLTTPPPPGPANQDLPVDQNPNIAGFGFMDFDVPLSAFQQSESAFDEAYNCHSFAWHNRLGDLDGQDPVVTSFGPFAVARQAARPFWDDSPIDDMANATQLGPNDIPQVGDIVVYVLDDNGNGFIDNYLETPHSAVVTQVVAGQVVQVASKPGAGAEFVHHPNAPVITTFYGTPTFIYRK